MSIETLEELKEKYNKLTKERVKLYIKISNLENKKILEKITNGDCFLNRDYNTIEKVTAINNKIIYSICLDKYSIKRKYTDAKDTDNWKKITSKQFNSIYLALLKDIQDPDFEFKEESNWDRTLKSIVENINNEK